MKTDSKSQIKPEKSRKLQLFEIVDFTVVDIYCCRKGLRNIKDKLKIKENKCLMKTDPKSH